MTEKPYESVSISTSEEYPRTNTPSDGEAVALEFGEDGLGDVRFTIEDSRNWYAWIEAQDDDSYVDLADRR